MFVTIPKLTLPARGVPADIDSLLQPYIGHQLDIPADAVLSYRIDRRSFDARKKPDVKILYHLSAEIADGVRPHGGFELCDGYSEYSFQVPENKSHLQNPVVVGSGPAGLFAGLVLAMAGAKPVILERGKTVDDRRADIEHFRKTRELNAESNYLYGEGGAGTWSDGKLFTRTRSEFMDFVLHTFVECGAPEGILYHSHPHLGSDKLPSIVSNLRKKIISLGGRFLWSTAVRDILLQGGRCRGVVTSTGERIESPAVLLATGHSARDLILSLTQHGVDFQMKGFQVGMRIEHLQSLVNRTQYGVADSYPALGAAPYNMALSPLSADQPQTGATTFCMCPGGEIIPAVSEPEMLCTNGMSNSARDGRYANSAVITTVDKNAFGNPAAVFDFLRNLERRAFQCGGGDYTAPAQTATDFLNGDKSARLPEGHSYCFGRIPYNLADLLPKEVTRTLRRALIRFDKMMPGFIRGGTFTGVETHVSSPVRFLRDAETLASTSVKGLWIAGEGAGMAGGITSAAFDGVKLAIAMLQHADK